MKVLISEGYGSGWSTYNDPLMAFDERLIRAFECGISAADMEALCVECGYIGPYDEAPNMLGFKGLKVVDVLDGATFRIREYDGHEWIEYFDPEDWYIAEGEFYDCY